MSGPCERITGKVARFVRPRAFGFIKSDDGRDIFFHASFITGGLPRRGADEPLPLLVGRRMSFALGQGDDGRQRAVDVDFLD
jgi:cold shock CspA family protein